MIAILRKNVAFLFSTHKSSVSHHFFATLRKKQSFVCPRVYELLLNKHRFSVEIASLVASDFDIKKNPERADSILLFLKDSGVSTTQLQTIVKYKPRILCRSEKDIKFKIKLFRDLGLSSEDTSKMISTHQMILNLSLNGNLIPSLSLLKGLLGSDSDVARLLRKSAWPLTADLKNTLVPNVEFLNSIGIPMEQILHMFLKYPRFLLIKQQVLRNSVEKVREMGFHESSKIFLYALRVNAFMSKGAWELKLQRFQEIGISESESLMMFKKFPNVFHTSMEKIEKLKHLLVATGRFDVSTIVNYPSMLGCSIENRLKPRLRIVGILESKNLIEWPSFSTISTMADDKFFDKFVKPYPIEVGKLYGRKGYVKEKVG